MSNKPAVKLVLYGPEGIGKSTFAAKFPKPKFTDTEGSTKFMDVERIPDKRPTSWAMVLDTAKYVRNHPEELCTYVIDTMDWAERLCAANICDTKKVGGIEDFGYGKGYTYLEEEIGRYLNILEEIVEKCVNIVLICHAQMRKFEQPDELGAYDRWELKLEKKVAALVKEWADIILFVNYKTYVVNVDNQGAVKGKNKAQGNNRVMYTTHHPCWDAKNRNGLADELPFDYSAIAHIPYAKMVASTSAPAILEEMRNVPCDLDEPAVRNDSPQNPPAQTEEPEPEQIGINDASAPMASELKALSDLMTMNNVTVAEIQWAVSHCGNGGKGYYPEDTSIHNYDPQFIKGVLIGAWTQVFGAIKANREKAS